MQGAAFRAAADAER